MIFTSRFTILALLTLLAGANAECAACQEVLYVDGVLTYGLVRIENSDNGSKKCIYVDKMDDVMTCEYAVRVFWMLSSSSFSFDTLDGHQDDGMLQGGGSGCPKVSKEENYPGCDVE
ncbi:uncharacterized protein HD556DRAFT_1047352 [Suillus plorans]|uniref:Uncharacterized protein n=1 Tax=Suillus plorans TaxID=116603 RepID=A0A9P7ACB3_9AGAM|nr:uncharacterized protein HD556DRAFT_1047352 [Suillus plorans]KAG1786532.1 hypothetical protein HD556DRAFT_1047352 [Suillus plorans]